MCGWAVAQARLALRDRDTFADHHGVPGCLDLRLEPRGDPPGAYTETDHYQVTRGFLSNPKRSLDILIADEGPD